MKKLKLRQLPQAILFCVVISTASHPTQTFALDLTAVGSFEVSNLTTNYGNGDDSAISNGVTFTNNGFSSGTAFGGGVLASQYIIPLASIETGFLYIPRSMSQTSTFSAAGTSGTLGINLNFNYWQIPLLVRIHFAEIFSVGFGGYYAHAVGNIKYSYTSSNAAVQAGLPSGTQYTSYSGNGVSQSDYGLLYAFGANVPIANTGLSVYGDARFELGLKNIQTAQLTSVNSNDSSDNNKWRDFQLLVGLSYSFDSPKNSASTKSPAETSPAL